MAEPALTYKTLSKQLSDNQLNNIYLLHGAEGYFIDMLMKQFEELIPEADRDFNLYNLYAPEMTPEEVVEVCLRYPMMAERQVVMLREAQAVPARYLEKLVPYMQQPSPTTLFVIASRGEACKSKALVSAVKAAGGVVFESPEFREYNIGPAITELITDKKLSIEPKALVMLKEFVGTDLSRIYNEIDKLTVTLPPGSMITPEVVEANIGVSKDYNGFELITAIATHDTLKAMKIVRYFKANPKGKNSSCQVVAATLFNYFTNLLICIYTPDKSDQGLMRAINARFPKALTDVRNGMRHYNAWHVIEIISAIRRFDAMTKGVGSRMDSYDLLLDLTEHILFPTGKL